MQILYKALCVLNQFVNFLIAVCVLYDEARFLIMCKTELNLKHKRRNMELNRKCNAIAHDSIKGKLYQNS